MALPLFNYSINNSKIEEEGVGEVHVFFAVTLEFVQMVEYVVSRFVIALSITGVLTNIINVIVFAKIGFSETINIMFAVLSISDLTLSVVLLVSCLAVTSAFESTNVLFLDIYDLLFVINPITWACFGLGSCVTAFIAVERSVCITLPLKVKSIFTRRRVLVLNIFFMALAAGELIQYYAVMNLQRRTDPGTNRTGLVFVVTDYFKYVHSIAHLVFSVGPSAVSFIVVSVGTSFLIVKLKESTRWRKSSSTGAQKQEISNKETRVIRSAVLVCLVYIVCFTPNVCIILATIIEPRLYMTDPYYGPFVTASLYLANVFQGISSTFNICIYLTTSIRFRQTCVIIFCRTKVSGNK